MRIVQGIGPILTILALTACGAGELDGDGEAPETADAASPSADEGEPTGRRAGAGAPTVEGLVEFETGGERITLDFLPDGGNHYLRIASAIVAQAGPSSTERFQIVFSGIDLRAHEYPAELPPERDMTDIRSAMMMVGFSWIAASGEEWAGPARVHIESFDDGVLEGTFGEVILPHTDDELPPLTVTNGSFRARLD